MFELQYFVIGFIQGVTEFLPISSSGHLVLAQHYMDINESGVKDPLFIAVLNGSFLFASDIMRKINIPNAQISFVKLSSYVFEEHKSMTSREMKALFWPSQQHRSADDLKQDPLVNQCCFWR